MFREMRRFKQLLPESEAIEILQRGTSGVLAVHGDDGYPYAVPLSHVYHDGKLYFHFAQAGHKLDSIQKDEKVSYCVIDKDEVIQETFTTHFRSAIAFGRMRVLRADDEKKRVLEILVQRFSPDFTLAGKLEAESKLDRLLVAELEIEHLTGKAAIELVNQKRAA